MCSAHRLTRCSDSPSTITRRTVSVPDGRSRTRPVPRRSSSASATAGQQSAATAPGQPESFVFPVTVALDDDAILVNGARVPLAPGMTVTVEIKTDSRRVIDYLLSPLAKVASEAGRER